MSYRKQALEKYGPFCAHCGFGIESVLQVAHIDMNRRNNKLDNLVILCPTCHRMLDLDLIPENVIKRLRDRRKVANWDKLLKDAVQKMMKTREKKRKKQEALRRKRSRAAKNPHITRKKKRA